MLISTAIQKVHKLSQGDVDYPSPGEDEFELILEGINDAINIWENVDNINWMELFSSESGTIVAGDADYALGGLAKWPASLLTIDGHPVNHQTPDVHALSAAMNPSSQHFFISGRVGARMLNIRPIPTAQDAGKIWHLDVYNSATTFESGEEAVHLQMSNPYFAIHHAISLITMEDDPSTASVHQQLANQQLDQMIIRNESNPLGTILSDQDISTSSFGR